MVEHKYPDGNKKMVWKGVVLEQNTFQGRGEDSGRTVTAEVGMLWSSSNPEVIGYVKPEYIASLVV